MNNLETQYEKAKADLDTHKAEKASDAVLAHVKSDGGTTTQIDENGVISIPDGVFMGNDMVYVNAVFTDSIDPLAVLTKTIPLGGNYSHGITVIRHNSLNANFIGYGIMVFHGTDNITSLVTGQWKMASGNAGGAWSRRDLGYIADQNLGFGVWGAVMYKIKINDVYIDGTNLKIVFTNETENVVSLNCVIDSEVW